MQSSWALLRAPALLPRRRMRLMQLHPSARAALCPTPPQLASSSRLVAAGSASLWSTWAPCWLGGPAGWGGRGQHRHQGWLKARCGTATAAARNVAPWCTLLQVPGCSLQRRTSQPAKSQAVKSSPLQTSHTRQGTATLATQSVSSHSPLNALPILIRRAATAITG